MRVLCVTVGFACIGGLRVPPRLAGSCDPGATRADGCLGMRGAERLA
jgi:hypothetical protein